MGYIVTVRNNNEILWDYECDMVMCAKSEEPGDKLRGVLRIYRTGERAYDTEWDWRVFGDICKKDDEYYRYAHVGAQTGTGDLPQGGVRFADGDTSDDPGPTISLKFVSEDEGEDEASPCDTGECGCYMGPIYSVAVGDIEFEETRSPDPAEAWGLFLPILERNPSFADRGVALREVVE